MAWALLPLLFLSVILGFTAIERDFATRQQPAVPSKVNSAAAIVSEFMAYRNAVMNYVQNQRTPNQPPPFPVLLNTIIQSGYFSQAETNALPAGAAAFFVPNTASNFGFFVCVWMPVPADVSAQVISKLIDWYDGDLTLGIVVGNNAWRQVGQGGTTQQIPCLDASLAGTTSIPTPSTGDIISVVGLGG